MASAFPAMHTQLRRCPTAPNRRRLPLQAWLVMHQTQQLPTACSKADACLRLLRRRQRHPKARPNQRPRQASRRSGALQPAPPLMLQPPATRARRVPARQPTLREQGWLATLQTAAATRELASQHKSMQPHRRTLLQRRMALSSAACSILLQLQRLGVQQALPPMAAASSPVARPARLSLKPSGSARVMC